MCFINVPFDFLSSEGSSASAGKRLVSLLPLKAFSDDKLYSGPTECLFLFLLQRNSSLVSMEPTERHLGYIADWAQLTQINIT